ncbi:MAG: OmpA family protein [Candidatus Schmidhempelia sp.]|nr:OmpA family protein [Candidatus Schmidhempelia sp.]
MHHYPWRLQIIYATMLSLCLILFFFPIGFGWKVIGIILVLSIALNLLYRSYRYRRLLKASTSDIQFLEKKLDLLPARQRYRLPIILVTGNSANTFFPDDLTLAESNIVVSSDAIWIYVEESAALPIVFDSLISRWSDMLGRIGLFLAINPEQEDKQGLFIAKLHAFRQSWVDTCRIAKYRLPVYVSMHVGLNNIQYNDNAPLPVYWYQLINKQIYLSDNYVTPIDNWVNSNKITPQEREQRMHIRAMLTEVAQWFEQTVLTALADRKQPIMPCIPTGKVILPLNNQHINNHLLELKLLERTSLILPNTKAIQEVISPPDRLVKLMPISYPFTPLTKMILGFIIITSFFLIGCLTASYFNNQKLIKTIQEDIHHFDVIADSNYDEKLVALNTIKADRQLLNDYFQKGEPLRLGFGLYRGQQLIEPLTQAISRYVPKPPEPPEPEKIIIETIKEVIKQPQIIRLDSISLFESGQSKLKAESYKFLINALADLKNQIKQNNEGGWLILITGHTDSTGQQNKNLQLSRERADVVRDWIIKNSDIPETCFATQGLGAKKPLMNNDSPENRAQNRRVEISLIPQPANCLLNEETSNNFNYN